MNIIIKSLALLIDLMVKTISYIIKFLYSLMKRAISSERFKKVYNHKTDFAGVKEVGVVLLIFFGAYLCWTPVQADWLTFNFSAPETVAEWNIPSHVLKGSYNEYQYKWTDYAWNKYHDKEFMYMLASENGLFNHDRQSLVYDSSGRREPSYGFCQIHRGYHPNIVNDPRFFSDPAWQMDKCYEKFTGGTVFYGYTRFKKSEREGTEFARARKALFNFN